MKIGIIGCGNMGRALLKAILSAGLLSKRNILVSEKDRKKINFVRAKFKVKVSSSNSKLFKECGVIILAVKPQDLQLVLQDAPLPLRAKLIISICAGISTTYLQAHLGKVAVVRVMPNLPGQIGQGISAISLGKYARAQDKKLASSIFSCIGEVVEVKEKLMHAVTAISGSGPAYFYYLLEQLIATAEELGISHHTAQSLALKAALGSMLLLDQSKEGPDALRKKVSSKGGTTEAAFAVFRKKGLDKILAQGIKAAAKRSKQLQNR